MLDLHNDDAVWLVNNEESVILQRLAYWLDLYGQEPTSNPKRKRVRIPLAQKFTAESLTQIMEKRYANILQSLGGVM